MAETRKNFITVIYNETIYHLPKVPSEDSLVVKEKAESLKNQLNLKQLCDKDIKQLGGLVQLAYFGVVGHAKLQSEVRPALANVSDLCDNMIQTLNGLKRCLHGVIIRIQTVYEYLEISSETNALKILKKVEELQPIPEELIQNSKSLSQNCWKKAEHLLTVRHTAEQEKQVAVDEEKKEKEQISVIKIEKAACEFLIKKSHKIISQETKKIAGYNKNKSKISDDKTQCEIKYKNDLKNASKKCTEQLNNLKSKYDSSNAKLIKDSKKMRKKHDASVEINSEITWAASATSATSTRNKDQHNEAEDQLMQESKEWRHVDDEKPEKNKSSVNKEQISKGHQSTQISDQKETNKNITCDTDIVHENYTSTIEHTKSLSVSTNDDFEQETVAAMPKLHETSLLENNDTDKTTSQDENIKVASTKENQVSEKQKVVTGQKEIDLTAISSSKGIKNRRKGKEQNISVEEQKEALLQEYLQNKQQVEVKTQNIKTDIQNKYQSEIKKLDEKFEKLNQQVMASETAITDHKQKIKELQQKIPELSTIINEKVKVNSLNSTSIDCICHTIAALFTVGSIMTKLGNFLKDFTANCCQLNDKNLFRQIRFLQKNNELWKSNTFKLTILHCYGNYVAFTNICITVIKCITEAQEEVYQNVCKDLSRDEAFKLVQQSAPNLVHQFEL